MNAIRALNNATSDKSDYVFISYSHKDKKYVMEDMQELAKNGVVFWYDDGIGIGDDWEQTVMDVINNSHCKGMILYVSKNFLLSQAILKEISLLNEKLQRNQEFKYFPVFISIKSVYNTLREIDVSEEAFLTLLKTFPSSLVHQSKTLNKFTHVEKLTSELRKIGVVQDKFAYDSRNNFKTQKHVIKNVCGLKLIEYAGLEKNLLIPDRLNGETIISIGHDCFRGNNTIESVVLPEGLIEICDMAFKECTALKHISIPTTLEYIGYETFRDCTQLESVIFSQNIQYVGDYCFYRCHHLINAIFNAVNAVKLGYAAFSECISLKELNLPKNISELGSYCFYGCASLESATLPRKINAVGDYVFLNCTKLSQLYIKTEKPFPPNNIFENCNSLNAIIFSTDNYEIFKRSPQWHAYKNLISVKLFSPGNIEVTAQGHILWTAVIGCDVYEVSIKTSCGNIQRIKTPSCCLEKYTFEENNTYYISVRALSSTSDFLQSDPSKELRYDYKLTQFDIDNATHKLVRYNRNGETRIIIPNEIRIIGRTAFEEACDVEEIIFGENVETDECGAFIRCRSLRRIMFNKKLREIESSAFAYCSNLETVKFNEGFLKLGEFSFACCDELHKVDFSASCVKEIPERCFYRCIKLNNVIWNNAITIFRNSAFRGCSTCEFSELPPNLEDIEETVFSFNTSCKCLKLPSGIKSLASDFLWHTFNIEKVSIEGSSLFYTKQNALFDTLGTLIYYPVNSKIKHYTSPNDCQKISRATFSNCAFLEQVNLEKVETIEHNNFENCKKLKKVVLGKNIKSVGDFCFNDCNSLSEVVFLCDNVPTIGDDCFLNCNTELLLIMNKKLIARIKKSKRWEKLLNNLQNKQCFVKITSL